MRKSFPPDVFALSSSTLLHVRLERADGSLQPERIHLYRIPTGVFGQGAISPPILDPEGLGQTIQRVRSEAGDFAAVSLLLPDSWFRMSILEIENFPDKTSDAEDMVHWTLRKSLPVQQEEMRLAWHQIERSSKGAKVLIVSASDRTLTALETACSKEGIQVVLVEPIGLNIWNVLSQRARGDSSDRVFFYFRDGEFTTALFRGDAPVFVRSRPLTGERSILQELKLSASYLRSKAQLNGITRCLVAGSRLERWILDAIHEEFNAEVEVLTLQDLAIRASAIDVEDADAEIIGCLGVFAS